jgi:hypothetical protein
MIKKILLIALISLSFLRAETYAVDTGMVDLRNKIFAEARQIKASLARSKDAALLINMFDSCILSITQIDGYHSMLGVMETIKNQDLTQAAVDFVYNWLSEIKRTNELNIRNIESVTQQIESDTRVFLGRTKGYFSELNRRIDKELNRLALVKMSLKQ